MTGSSLRRAFAMLAACLSVALLAACGSSTTESQFNPTRIVSFGDAFSDVGQANGAKYSVNDGAIDTWLDQLASRYPLTIKTSSTGGFAYGRGSARITLKPDAAGNAATLTVTEQIDAFLATKTLSDNDLVVIGGGIADIITEVQAVIAGTQTEDQAVARLQTTAKELGAQARRLVAAGAKHVVVVGAYNLGITPYATTANRVSTFLNASSRYNETFLVSVVDLGATVLYVDAAYYFNLVGTNPGNFAVDNATAVACTSIDPGPGIGIGAGQVNSALCTISTIVSGADYTKYMFADPIYTTPPVQRLFGDYAFDRIRARW
jgi:phospholipase/lecithinase/hemolysin